MAKSSEAYDMDDSVSVIYTFLASASLDKDSRLAKTPVMAKPLPKGSYIQEIRRINEIANTVISKILPEILRSMKIPQTYCLAKLEAMDTNSEAKRHFFTEHSHRIIQDFCRSLEAFLKASRSKEIGDFSAYMELEAALFRPDKPIDENEEEEEDDDDDVFDEEDENVRENNPNTLLGFETVLDLSQEYIGRCVKDRSRANVKAFKADFYDSDLAAAYITIIFTLIITFLRDIEFAKLHVTYLKDIVLPAHDDPFYIETLQDEINAMSLAYNAISKSAKVLAAMVTAETDLTTSGMAHTLMGVPRSRALARFIQEEIYSTVEQIYNRDK